MRIETNFDVFYPRGFFNTDEKGLKISGLNRIRTWALLLQCSTMKNWFSKIHYLSPTLNIQSTATACLLAYTINQKISITMFFIRPLIHKNAVPLPQFLRLRRLWSDDSDLISKCEEKPGYPDSAVVTSKHRAQEIDRETATQRHKTSIHPPLSSTKPCSLKCNSQNFKFSIMIPKLNICFLCHRLFHSNTTKTQATFLLGAYLSLTTNRELSNVHAHDA